MHARHFVIIHLNQSSQSLVMKLIKRVCICVYLFAIGVFFDHVIMTPLNTRECVMDSRD